MEIFLKLIEQVGANVPAWVPLIVRPALVAALAVLFTVVGGRKAYAPLSLAVGAAGVFFVCCAENATIGLIYAALFLFVAGLFSLLFLIPCPLKKRAEGREDRRRARDEAIYQTFREELELPEENVPAGEKPLATAEECGTCLSHVTALLAKLKKEKLSPADRLEIEALTRTVEGYRGKALSEKELHLVNDCLATVLKLTAKYKL